MASETDAMDLSHHDSSSARALLDELCATYADAYGVDLADEKVAAFRDRAIAQLDRPAFDLITAYSGATMTGFVFGYALPEDTSWWDGLAPDPAPEFCHETGQRTAVLSEIEVRQSWQGRRLGRALHDAFIAERTEERATLATGPSAERAREIYERWGWTSVGTVPGGSGAYFAEYHLFVLPLLV